MLRLPSSLRAKVSVVFLLGIFLIPMATSSLRGLTHVLSCQEGTLTDFSITVDGDLGAALGSSTVARPGDDTELCGGLEPIVSMRPASATDSSVELVVSIVNHTEHRWHGSMYLSINGDSYAVPIGEISAGGTASSTVPVKLRDTRITGDLLIGP